MPIISGIGGVGVDRNSQIVQNADGALTLGEAGGVSGSIVLNGATSGSTTLSASATGALSTGALSSTAGLTSGANGGTGGTLTLNGATSGSVQLATPATGGTLQFNTAGSFTANGTVATAVTSLGPTGASTTIVKWLTIIDNTGATRYIPCF